tara:strand:- start:808 stop:1767 length:960 start_codon:yes stop_codon:yes gene_type:complete
MKIFFKILKNLLFAKEIIIIASPLQLINLHEFNKKYKNIVNFKYPIFISSRQEKATLNQIRQTCKKLNIKNELIFLNDHISLKNIFFLKNVRKFFLPKYEKCVLGNYFEILQNELFKISKKKYLLDDGGSTLLLNKNSFKNYINNLKFFSIYKNLFSKKNFYENNYDYLKKKLKDKKTNNKIIHFISSQNYHYSKKKNQEAYFNDFKKLIKKFKKYKIIYIAHRKENMNFVRKQINLKVIKLNLPLEIYYLTSKYYPKHIITNYSSSTFTLKKIFNNRINLINYNSNLNLFDYRRKEFIKNYSFYKKIYQSLNIKQIKF